MPGLVGLVSENVDYQIFEAMCNTLKHFDFYDVYFYKSSKFSAALVSNKAFPQVKQPIKNGDILFFFDGELYNNESEKPDIEFVLDNYVVSNSWSFLKDLEGIFSFVLFDQNSNKLFLGVDKFGLKHIFYTHLAENFLFASELKAFVKHPRFPKSLDYKTLSQIFHFSFALGDHTLFEAAKLLPNATVLEYDLGNKKLSLFKYWDELSLFTPKGQHRNISYQEISLLFQNAVKKRLKYKERLGISLSGGLDSRSILAALGEEARGMPSYTLGLPGCQDEKLAARMAQVMGTNHEFVPITEDSLRDFLNIAKTIVFHSDGFYFPHECTEKIAFDYFKSALFKILFRGHGGELLKSSLAFPVRVDKHVSEASSPSELSALLLNKTNLVVQDISLDFLFLESPIREKSLTLSSDIFQYIRRLWSVLCPEDIFMFFFLFDYIYRQAVASLNIFRTFIEIRVPFLDEKLLRAVFTLPPDRRKDGEIQKFFVRLFAPLLTKIPDANTGAPLDTSGLALFLRDKINSLIKRLSIPGFRHYNEFEKWHRKYFREAIENILFDSRTLERGLYRKEGLEEVFRAHISGKKNYARLLGTVVGLELWFREFVD